MSEIVLNAKNRETSTSVNELRKKNIVPAVLYGHGIKNKNLSVTLSEFNKAYRQAGESMLVDLVVEKEAPVKVLIHDTSRDVETHTVEHIDFYQVNMNEPITTDIPIVFSGVAPAVKTLGGILITQLDSIPVKCLPKDLVKAFIVDLSVLTDFNDKISIEDIKDIPESMEVLREKDSTVALVSAPRVVTKSAEETADEEAVEAGNAEKNAADGDGEAKAEGGDGSPAESK